MRYEEVRVRLFSASDGQVGASFTFEGMSSPIEHTFVPPNDIDGEGLYRDWLNSFKPESPLPKEELARQRDQVGYRLFEILFEKAAGALRERLTALDQRQAGDELCGLRLRLILGDALGSESLDASTLLPVSKLPWELSIDRERGRRLAKSRFLSIVRTIGTSDPPRSTRVRIEGQLRVLVVDSQPEGAAPLNWPAEKARIKDALKKWKYAYLEFLDYASFKKTCQRLEDGSFNVVHFIGHGGVDRNGHGYLLFEKDRKRDPVFAADIADRFGDIKSLKVAVLNACRSGQISGEVDGDPLSGVAAALSAKGIPVVVAMQIPVTDGMAIEFSEAFYSTLRSGLPVETAVAKGRHVVRLSSPEWATPVLYLRGSSSELFDFRSLSGEPIGIPVDRSDDVTQEVPKELVIGVRSLVESKDRYLADWAVKFNETTERFAPLEEFFHHGLIPSQVDWNNVLLPRLGDFLADAVNQHRPIVLCLAAHVTVAFAAGYFFYTKKDASLALLQMTAGRAFRWSAEEGSVPKGPLWQPFAEELLNSRYQDIALAVEITQETSEAMRTYIVESGVNVGRLISVRVEPGKARVESGAHAFQLASQLCQWLKDHARDHGKRRLHLFISAPNGFTFFFGQLARNLGSLRLYERDFEGTGHGTYNHSLDLPPSRVDFQQDTSGFDHAALDFSVRNQDGNIIIGSTMVNSLITS